MKTIPLLLLALLAFVSNSVAGESVSAKHLSAPSEYETAFLKLCDLAVERLADDTLSLAERVSPGSIYRR